MQTLSITRTELSEPVLANGHLVNSDKCGSWTGVGNKRPMVEQEVSAMSVSPEIT